MQVRDIIVKGKVAQGIEINLPKSVLVIAIAPKGYIMCGYLNKDVAESFGDCAAIVRGVKNIDELLSGPVKDVTSNALKLGIKPGMKGLTALSKMF